MENDVGMVVYARGISELAYFCKKKSEDLTQDQLIDKVSLLELENKIYRILMGIHKIRFLCIHRRNLKV